MCLIKYFLFIRHFIEYVLRISFDYLQQALTKMTKNTI